FRPACLLHFLFFLLVRRQPPSTLFPYTTLFRSRGQLIVLESTTYPGTTRELMLPALEETGLQVGEDFFLAFSPERVDPGNPKWNTHNTPKVVGGLTAACRRVAIAVYEPAIEIGR